MQSTLISNLYIDEANKLLASFKKEEDKVENRTFYYPSAWSWYDSDTWAADKRSFILPYLVKRGDEMYLYYTVNYIGKDWVFLTRLLWLLEMNGLKRITDMEM